jgi:hypothetical protein
MMNWTSVFCLSVGVFCCLFIRAICLVVTLHDMVSHVVVDPNYQRTWSYSFVCCCWNLQYLTLWDHYVSLEEFRYLSEFGGGSWRQTLIRIDLVGPCTGSYFSTIFYSWLCENVCVHAGMHKLYPYFIIIFICIGLIYVTIFINVYKQYFSVFLGCKIILLTWILVEHV